MNLPNAKVNDHELVTLLVDDARIQLEIWDKATKELISSHDVANVDDLLGVTHTLKGCAFSIGLHELGGYLHSLEDILGMVKNYQMRVNALGQKFLIKVHKLLSDWIKAIEKGWDFEPEITQANLLNIIETKDFDFSAKTSLGAILVDSGLVTADQIKAAVRIQNSRIGELLVSQSVISEAQLEKALEKQKEILASQPPKVNIEFAENVFVPAAELDRLYDLCNQALISASGKTRRLVHSIQEIVEQYTATPMSRLEVECQNIAAYLKERLSKNLELQFNCSQDKIPNRIYHILQKTIPHLIRNAADHGIEPPEERSNNNKDIVGTIDVEVVKTDNEIMVSVKDDGRGIEHHKLSDIFAHGYTSAKIVSEISGRGVGLDTVKSTIETAGGNISVTSVQGRGTEFIMKLPT